MWESNPWLGSIDALRLGNDGDAQNETAESRQKRQAQSEERTNSKIRKSHPDESELVPRQSTQHLPEQLFE